MEVYVLIEKKKSLMMKVLGIAGYALGVVSLVLAMVGELVFFLMAVAFLVLGWLLFNCSFEYEYSYFDGEFRFAKIFNKSRRKELKGYTADELILIAPIEDRAVYQYINNAKIKTLDYTSGSSDAKIFVMVAKTESDIKLIKYEPNEKYLDEVCIKYRQKVIR